MFTGLSCSPRSSNCPVNAMVLNTQIRSTNKQPRRTQIHTQTTSGGVAQQYLEQSGYSVRGAKGARGKRGGGRKIKRGPGGGGTARQQSTAYKPGASRGGWRSSAAWTPPPAANRTGTCRTPRGRGGTCGKAPRGRRCRPRGGRDPRPRPGGGRRAPCGSTWTGSAARCGRSRRAPSPCFILFYFISFYFISFHYF